MQEQAAPPRFRGNYPHELSIPRAHIPRDKFLQAELNCCIEGLKKMNIVTSTRFPKLVLDVKDPEILHLAGPDLSEFDCIDCKFISCTCQDKPRYMQLFQSTVADRDSIVYNPCKRTLFAAAKRQVKSAPVPDLAVVRDFVGFAKQSIERLIGDDLRDFGYSFNQWYNHLTYAKQRRMDAIHEFIHGCDPLKDHYVSVERTDPKMFHYEAICKIEIQGTDGKPRMVCSIPDLIKYVMGPICWKLEELFAQKIPTYCGGQNLGQMQSKINHLIDEGFCVIAEGDGSAFDNTQDVLLKEVDRHIYSLIADRVHHVPKDLFLYVANAYYKIMDVVQVEGKKRKVLMTYAVLGTVFSGDCDTTLMNTLRMGLYNWYTNERAGLVLGRDYVAFSKGDDFTVMYKRSVDFDKVRQYYNKYWLGKPKPSGPAYDGCDERIYGLGQILKFIEFGPPHTIKFCSLRAWYTNPHSQHIYLTRDPGKFTTLSKYSRKALHMSDRALADYLIDQAVSLETACKNIHYFADFAQAYRKIAAYYAGGHATGRGGKERDRRRTLDLEVSDPLNGYNYSHRVDDQKIVGSYWDTMKQIWLQNDTTLSSSEWNFVNNQIDSEFADRPIFLLGAV
jgi:hypothetical protein